LLLLHLYHCRKSHRLGFDKEWGTYHLSWLGKTAKSLFIFTLLFLLDLLHRKKYGKVSHHSHMIGSHRSHHIMSHSKSHNGCEKVVHRPYSSYISSVENLTGTLSSSLSQMVTYYLWWVLWYFKEFKNAKLDKWQKMLLSLRSNPQYHKWSLTWFVIDEWIFKSA